jgi:hypothetical protein
MKRILFLILYLPVIAFSSIVYECRYDEVSVLPVDVVNLILPKGEVAESLKVEVLSSRTLPKTYEIKTSLDYLDYKTENPSPEVRAELIGTNILAGNSIARIAVYPLASLPGEDKVVFYDNIRLTLYTKFSGKHNISQKVRTQYSDHIESEALRSIVDNYYEIPLSPEVSGKVRSLTVEYIIITNESLSGGFEVFANYLKKKGVVAEIATVEDIVSSTYYDNISGLYDPPGAIRGYLMEKYAEGVTWVLLGGDEDIVPVRYGTYARNDTFVDLQAPSDLYYSDLNGNWNVDGDEFLGEPLDDSVDVFPELFVGRIPCDNLQEVANWFEKLVSYETNPGEGNTGYLTKFFWTGSDDVREGPKYTIENAQLPGYISHDTTMLEVEPEGAESEPRGSDVIDKMNEHFGLFYTYGHGSPNVITVSAPGNNSPSMDRNFVVSEDWVESGNCYKEYGNGLDSLTNEDYYAILSMCSCFQAAFDYEKFPERFIVRGPSMGEAFLLLPERGGPAFRGYTRYGGQYIQLGKLEVSFLDKLFVDKITNIGVAEALSKNEYPFYYVQSNHTLFGCPLMRVWTDVPGRMNVYHDTLITPGFKNMTITVTVDDLRCKGKGVSNAYVCLWKGDEVYERGYTDENGYLSLEINPTTGGTMSVTVTKENMLPYEGEVTVQGPKLLAERISVSQSDRSQWHTFDFPETYSNPIVVMGPPSCNDSSPTTIRVKDVESNGFKFQMEEWDYLDGIHGEETISFLAMEEGVHRIDGKTWEAGRICCPKYEDWVSVNFKSWGFKCCGGVIVLAQAVTDNLDFPLVTRVKDVTPYGFKVMIQNEENNEDLYGLCHDKPEIIHYIAIQTGSGRINDDEIFTVSKTTPGQTPAINHEWNTVEFPVIDTVNAPVFLAGMQTFRADMKKHRCEIESDPASLRYKDLTNTEVTVKVEEEQSADLEVEHTAEDIGYLAVFKTATDTSAIDAKEICENYIKPAASIITGSVILNISSSNDRKASIELIDIAGRVIEKKDYNLKRGKAQINFGQFKSGIYFFRILQEEANKTKIYKITVLR